MQQRQHHVDRPQGDRDLTRAHPDQAGVARVGRREEPALLDRAGRRDLGQLASPQRPGDRVVVDQQPRPLPGDADGDDVVAVTVQRREHAGRGDARDAVLLGAAAEKDGDTGTGGRIGGHGRRG